MTGAGKVTALEANALADGELTGEVAAHVRRAVEADGDLKATADFRDTLNLRLHEAFDGELDRCQAEAATRLLAASERPGWATYGMRIAAGMLIAATAGLAGYGLGTGLGSAGSDLERVARSGRGAHAIFVAEKRHPVEVPGAERDHLSAWLGKRLGLPFIAPDLTTHGYALVGGRLLAQEARPAALVMYESASGERVTLYVEYWPGDGETPLQRLPGNELSTVYWGDNHTACAVSGKLPEDRLTFVAERIYAALEPR